MGTIRLGKRTEDRVPLIKELVPMPSLDDIVLAAHDRRQSHLDGPLLEDVARTLQEIVRHDLPAATSAAS